jgi:hypothetical protein
MRPALPDMADTRNSHRVNGTVSAIGRYRYSTQTRRLSDRRRSMSDPRDTDPRYADLKRRLDEAPSGGGSMWPWLAGLVAVLALVGMSIGYNWTHEASDNQYNGRSPVGTTTCSSRQSGRQRIADDTRNADTPSAFPQ